MKPNEYDGVGHADMRDLTRLARVLLSESYILHDTVEGPYYCIVYSQAETRRLPPVLGAVPVSDGTKV